MTPTPDNVSEALREFDDFLNEPTDYEEKYRVRDYRHSAYAKWTKLRELLAARTSTAPVAREPAEERFRESLGRYESPEDLARGMRMSANHFRNCVASRDVPQPLIMADFHDRVAVALERFIASAPQPAVTVTEELVEAATKVLWKKYGALQNPFNSWGSTREIARAALAASIPQGEGESERTRTIEDIAQRADKCAKIYGQYSNATNRGAASALRQFAHDIRALAATVSETGRGRS